MQVILLDKIAKLGGLGDQVAVKAGYARNYLIPQGKAVMATKANIETFDARRAELEAKLAAGKAAAEERAAKLGELAAVVIASKSGDEGKLFGSIGTRDVAEAITAAGVAVARGFHRCRSDQPGHRQSGQQCPALHAGRWYSDCRSQRRCPG